jgi:hypothetical protein
MKYLIYNITKDKFWSDNTPNEITPYWSDQHNATLYTYEELELMLKNKKESWALLNPGDVIIAVIAVSI